MAIRWFRARLDSDLDPWLLRPFLYVCFGVIVLNTGVAIAGVVTGAYSQASLASLAIVATFYVLMRGLHDAEQQVRWRDRVEREHAAVIRATAGRTFTPRGRQ
jgi:hypothetical protein